MELTPEQQRLTELMTENEKLKADLKKLQAKKSGLFIHEQPEEVELDVYEKGKLPVLKRISDKDVVCGGKDHLLIEGDNLHTLMALQITHRNKVDVIYIDPPYNTGNKDFKYNDRFVDKEDNWRHNKWLSFMSRRLRLARELMSDSGVIFISIDDNEQAQLKLLCDDIFGEDNFVACCAVVNNLKGRNDAKYFKTAHEYLLVYSKTEKFKIGCLELTQEEENEYNLEDTNGKYKIGRILRKTGDSQYKEDRPNLYFPIYVDKENNVYFESAEGREEIFPKAPDGKDSRWTWSKEKVKNEIGELIAKRTKNNVNFYIKQRLNDNRGIYLKSFLYDAEYSTGSGVNSLKKIGISFNAPKSVKFIKDLFKVGGNENAIILDFFAGSGTTGQAVLELNKEDGGNRQFILATNNENNICEEITRERMKRIMEGYTNSKKESVAGLGNNLRYFKTDFVQNSNSDTQLRLNLMDGYGDMICVGENVFSLVKETACYKIFENDNKTVAFVKSDKNLNGLVDHFKQAKGKKKVYKFELEDAKDPDFEELFDGVEGVKFFGISSIIRSYIRLMRRK